MQIKYHMQSELDQTTYSRNYNKQMNLAEKPVTSLEKCQ